MILTVLAYKKVKHIFPTEVAARFWMEWTAEHVPPYAVKSSQFVSWDTWIEEQASREQDGKPADSLFRLVASRLLCETLDLEYFIPSQAGGETEQFTSLVASVLPKLDELTRRTLPGPLKRDVMKLIAGYGELLDRSRRYEPAFLQDELSWDDQASLVLWYPEMITGFDRLAGRVAGHPRVMLITTEDLKDLSDSQTPQLNLFDDSIGESSRLLQEIEALLSKGAGVEEICITAGEYDRWRSHLSHEAKLRGIPLSFRQGGPLGGYAPGRLFRALQQCVHLDWPLGQAKTLLLDRGCRWKHREVFERIAEAGIKHRCIIGGSQWSRALSADREAHDIWRRFTSHVRKVVQSADPREMRESLFGFLDMWLLRDDRAGDEYDRVFDYCLQRLDRLCRTAEELLLDRFEGLYSLWLRDLQASRYVPQQQTPGIPVYPYGLSAGIRPKYHFAVGLSQEGCSQTFADIPFFSDAELSRLGLGEDDRTEGVFSLTEYSGDQVVLSGSRRSFSGVSMPPVRYAGRTVDGLPNSRDPYEAERKWWAGAEQSSSCYPLQLEGFTYACDTHLLASGRELFDTPLGSDHPAHRQLLHLRFFSKHPGMVSITPYGVDAFTRCRFTWVCSFLLDLQELEGDPVFLDPRDEGNLIHECLHRFFSEAVGLNKPFAKDQEETYRSRMEEVIEAVLSEGSRSRPWLIPGVRHQLSLRLSSQLGTCIQQELQRFDGWICSLLEESMEIRRPERGWRASGRVDRVSRDPEERRGAIIDYKRSRPKGSNYLDEDTPPPSWQLPFYALLLGEEDLAAACFYAVRDGSYLPALDTLKLFPRSRKRITDLQQFLRLLEELTDIMDRMAVSIQEGDYRDRPAVTGCSDCRDRMLCRRRYHVR